MTAAAMAGGREPTDYRHHTPPDVAERHNTMSDIDPRAAGLTPEQLDDLRRLANEAWPAPWEKFGNTITLKARGEVARSITLPGDHQTLAFIAASREAIPALLDHLAAVIAQRDDWQRKAEQVTVDRDDLRHRADELARELVNVCMTADGYVADRDHWQRKAEQAERTYDLLAVAYAYADHLSSCQVVDATDDTCDCGYREVARAIEADDADEPQSDRGDWRKRAEQAEHLLGLCIDRLDALRQMFQCNNDPSSVT